MNLILILSVSQRDSILQIISFISNGVSYKKTKTDENSGGQKIVYLWKAYFVLTLHFGTANNSIARITNQQHNRLAYQW